VSFELQEERIALSFERRRELRGKRYNNQETMTRQDTRNNHQAAAAFDNALLFSIAKIFLSDWSYKSYRTYMS
jgi:hypothetical protein